MDVAMKYQIIIYNIIGTRVVPSKIFFLYEKKFKELSEELIGMGYELSVFDKTEVYHSNKRKKKIIADKIRTIKLSNAIQLCE